MQYRDVSPHICTELRSGGDRTTALEQTMRPWLEEQADRIEDFYRTRLLPVRVRGGVVSSRLVEFHLTPSALALMGRLVALEEALSRALDTTSARLVRHGDTLALEVARPQPPPVSLLRLHASLPSVPPCTALLGRDEQGSALLLRISSHEVRHVVIAGTSGAGKTILARTILTSLALTNAPGEMHFLLVDPQGRSFTALAGLPHLATPIVRAPGEALQRLCSLGEEVFNRGQGGMHEPRVVVAVDDLGNLLREHPAVGELLVWLSTYGPAAGIHLLLCDDNPGDNSTCRRLWRSQSCRIVGQMESAEDAARIQAKGAERLLGRGDFLLTCGDECLRFQAATVGAKEIALVVAMLQQEAGGIGKETDRGRNAQVVTLPLHAVQRVANEMTGRSGVY